MKQQTLSEFVDEKGQTLAAQLLRLTQPGLRKALHADRQIYVTHLPDGTYEAAEVRPFPTTKREQPGAA